MDPQANLTSGIGYDPYHLERTVFQVLTGESPDGSAILSSKYKIDLLPSSPDLSAVESASTRVSFPRLPDIEEPDARIAVASAIPIGALTQPEPRLRRSRAMAGWYGFLAVLAVASFSLTNLAINHDTTLSIETGAVAGVGLVAVVILLATGHWPVGHLRPA
jgi:hypothetical protein